MPRPTKHRYLANVLVAVAILSIYTPSQDRNIWNEYRATVTTVMPVNERFFLWQYTGYFFTAERKQNTFAFSPPGVMYRVKPWMEVWAGMLPSYTDNYVKSNSWELRPLVGLRTAIPNKRKLNIYNFARYEFKLVNQDGNMQSIPRFRNRIGMDMPLQTGDKRWTPRSFYTVTDFEPIWRLDDKYLEKLRLRAGAGYIINKNLAVEIIHHTEWAGAKGEPKKYVGNLWRINFKIVIPRGVKALMPRVDIDD